MDRDFQEFLCGARKDLGEFGDRAARDVREFQEEIDRTFAEFLHRQWVEKGLSLEAPEKEPPKPSEEWI